MDLFLSVVLIFLSKGPLGRPFQSVNSGSLVPGHFLDFVDNLLFLVLFPPRPLPKTYLASRPSGLVLLSFLSFSLFYLFFFLLCFLGDFLNFTFHLSIDISVFIFLIYKNSLFLLSECSFYGILFYDCNIVSLKKLIIYIFQLSSSHTVSVFSKFFVLVSVVQF